MSNEQQAAYWNEVGGPKWVQNAAAMDARLAGINRLLLDAASAATGERVLDIGCGTGTTTLALAEAVGPAGRVTGIDISATMLAEARARCGDLPNVTLGEADAQLEDFGGEKFNLLTSRFGVMFFADPVAAFANLRAALAPGGRLCFVCWAGLAANPHWRIPFELTVAACGEPAPKPPGAPGPMALSAPDHVIGILRAAGFSGISVTATKVEIIGRSLAEEARIAGTLGPAGALLDEKQADGALRRRLQAEFEAAFQPFDTADGPRLPATVNLVRAGY